MRLTANSLGWYSNATSSGSTTLNSANARFGVAFIPEENITVANVRMIVGTKTASPVAADCVLEIMNEVATTGLPNPASIVATSSATDQLASATWSTFTISASLTAGTRYWLSVKNTNSVPGTNYWTMTQVRNQNDRWSGNTTAHTGYEQGGSTDAWSTMTAQAGGAFEIEDTNGVVHGVPIESGPTADTNLIYGTRETGMLFIPQTRIVVHGVKVMLSRNVGTGTTNGNVTAKLYPALGSPVASAAMTIQRMTSTTSFDTLIPFTAPVMLEANVQHRVSFAYSINDSGQCIRAAGLMTFRNDSKSLTLKPWGSSATYSYYDGSTWTNSTVKVIPIALLCDMSEEFRRDFKPIYDVGAL